jgi:hypothetical protein
MALTIVYVLRQERYYKETRLWNSNLPQPRRVYALRTQIPMLQYKYVFNVFWQAREKVTPVVNDVNALLLKREYGLIQRTRSYPAGIIQLLLLRNI